MFNWISFLTYAVVTAVTPGPNNILSMSNGNRKGFRGALPFNFGILVGFSVVMLLCTAFCSLLSAWIPKIKLPMLIVGAAYMLYLAWETFRSSGVTEKDDARGLFSVGTAPAVYQSENLYLLHPVHGGLYSSILSRPRCSAGGICAAFGLHWICIYIALVGVWVCVSMAVFPTYEAGEYHHGPASGLLRHLVVFLSRRICRGDGRGTEKSAMAE